MIPQHEILEAAKEAGLYMTSQERIAAVERLVAIIERKTIGKCAAYFEAQPHMEHFGDNIAEAIRSGAWKECK